MHCSHKKSHIDFSASRHDGSKETAILLRQKNDVHFSSLALRRLFYCSFGQPSWPNLYCSFTLLVSWSFCCWPSLPVSWSSFFWRMPQTQQGNWYPSTRCNTAFFNSLLCIWYASYLSCLWMLWQLGSLLCKQASLYQFALSPQRIVVRSTHPTSEAWSRRVCWRGLQEKIQCDE